jgi:hypothetical protein
MNAGQGAIFSQYGSQPFVWLDYAAYAGRLLADGAPPWKDAAALVAWYRSTQALLKSDVVALPVAEVVSARSEAMTASASLATAADAAQLLGRVLSDAAVRELAVASLAGLRAVFPALPLVLHLPSPGAWVQRIAHECGCELDGEVDEDAIDTAAVVMADFLRSFSNSGLDGILVDELGNAPPAQADELYLPLLNVAQHYQWHSGWRRPGGARCGFGFTLGAEGDIEERDWERTAESKARPCYLVIPRDAVPETVLETLEAQR